MRTVLRFLRPIARDDMLDRRCAASNMHVESGEGTRTVFWAPEKTRRLCLRGGRTGSMVVGRVASEQHNRGGGWRGGGGGDEGRQWRRQLRLYDKHYTLHWRHRVER